jgi:hypothetical protein
MKTEDEFRVKIIFAKDKPKLKNFCVESLKQHLKQVI